MNLDERDRRSMQRIPDLCESVRLKLTGVIRGWFAPSLEMTLVRTYIELGG